MGVFESVRENVTARQVAEFYGHRVNRYGMAICPFHNDRNPSMKIDRRYYCFGCGAKGDAVDFVANAFGMNLKDAAIRIAKDFGIVYEKSRPPDMKQAARMKHKGQTVRARFHDTRTHFWRVLTDYYHALESWKQEYAPVSPDDDLHPLFVEALQNITQIEYIMDEFLDADLSGQIEIINDYGRKVLDYERRLEQCATGTAGSTGRHDDGIWPWQAA